MNYIQLNDCSLKQYNTLNLNSIAKVMVFPLNYLGVQEIYQKYMNSEIIILGNGSNILFSKDYYDEKFIFLSFKFIDNIEYCNSQILCEAGALLSKLSWYAVEQKFRGFEFLEDIPGSIGGAIIMNAGTYNDNIGELVESITYYDINKNEILLEDTNISDFGRRKSKWSNNNTVILSVALRAREDQRVEEYEILINNLLKIKKQRYLKQPRNYPNAGSVFKRPSLNGQDYFIWKLFDELNLRGYRKHGAMISEKHPGFIVNIDNAKSEDVLFLIKLAKKEVKSKLGIELELEWKII